MADISASFFLLRELRPALLVQNHQLQPTYIPQSMSTRTSASLALRILLLPWALLTLLFTFASPTPQNRHGVGSSAIPDGELGYSHSTPRNHAVPGEPQGDDKKNESGADVDERSKFASFRVFVPWWRATKEQIRLDEFNEMQARGIQFEDSDTSDCESEITDTDDTENSLPSPSRDAVRIHKGPTRVAPPIIRPPGMPRKEHWRVRRQMYGGFVDPQYRGTTSLVTARGRKQPPRTAKRKYS